MQKNIVQQEESSIDYRKVLRLCKKYWYFILIGLFLGLVSAFAYMRYTIPMYHTSLRLMIKDGKTTGQVSEGQILSELGLRPPVKNYENEILILSSVPLIMQVVDKLDLQYRYWIKGHVRNTDLYRESPIEVIYWEPRSADFPAFVMEVWDRGNNRLSLILHETTYTGEYGNAMALPYGNITLSRTPGRKPHTDRAVFIEVKGQDALARELSGRIHVGLSSRHTTVLLVNLVDQAPQRAEDILNELAQVYNTLEIRERNLIYENTINFIDGRLELLSAELEGVEWEEPGIQVPGQVLDFHSVNGTITGDILQSNKERAEWEMQMQILNVLEESLNAHGGKSGFIMTNITLNNATLTTMLNRLNDLQLEREKLATTVGPNHPTLQTMEKQLLNMRTNILENIGNLKNDLELQRSEMNNRRVSIQEKLTRLPRKEPAIKDVQLEKKIKQNLYAFLLQKKEESALKLAATVSSSFIIEEAYTDRSLVKPDEFIVYRNAIGLGLALPLALLIFIGITSDRIETAEDVRKLISIPLAGTIVQGRKKQHIAVKEKSRSMMAELFRLLRTNLHFVSTDTKNQVFLVTSIVPGEGKSFVSLNLGITMALAGKKTIILELDLRKPKLAQYLGLKKPVSKGLTQYLSIGCTQVEDIVQTESPHPNLHYIASGPVPPDPGELILSERLKTLMDILRSRYDIILIDSSPAGVVADTFLLKNLADTTIFIVRRSISRKVHLKMIEEIFDTGKLPRPQIVFNGMKPGTGANGYEYAVKHGYYVKD